MNQNVEFYNHLADFYDQIHGDRSLEIAFYQEQASNAQSILEVPVGSGVLAQALCRQDRRVVGVDLSEEMLVKARSLTKEVEFVKGDMCAFDLNETFDLVLCPLNSFMHLCTEDQALAALTCFKEHCSANGKVIVSIDQVALEYMPKKFEGIRAQFKDKTSDSNITVLEKTKFDRKTNIMNVQWSAFDDDTRDLKATSSYDNRFYSNLEIRKYLEKVGLRVIADYGDYEKNERTNTSSRQILISECA
ncbi:class I SAM-dependent DNA methyltransferase [Epibacterium ulvae]|uniref:class I SAM-dependent DNA methyltransferase n=1 Tax=Epibacterium ulvae TaxID=1156985 RepID=UPI00249084A4|nr:class I SAM-dependent methyltransferase [Epibacterium ulvae]